jgi:hypothetical protein
MFNFTQEHLQAYLDYEWQVFLRRVEIDEKNPAPSIHGDQEMSRHSDNPHPSVRAHYPFHTPRAEGVPENLNFFDEKEKGYPQEKTFLTGGTLILRKQTNDDLIKNLFQRHRLVLLKAFRAEVMGDDEKHQLESALNFFAAHQGKPPLNLKFDAGLFDKVYSIWFLRRLIDPNFNRDNARKFLQFLEEKKVNIEIINRLHFLSGLLPENEEVVIDEWLVQFAALKLKHPRAQRAIGDHYAYIAEGQKYRDKKRYLLASRNRAKAQRNAWYQKAADQGDEVARHKLEALQPVFIPVEPSAPPASLAPADVKMDEKAEAEAALQAAYKQLEQSKDPKDKAVLTLLTDTCAITTEPLLTLDPNELSPLVPKPAKGKAITQADLDAVLRQTPQGFIYNKTAIETWVRAHGDDPQTREPLTLNALKPVAVNLIELNRLLDLQRRIYGIAAPALERAPAGSAAMFQPEQAVPFSTSYSVRPNSTTDAGAGINMGVEYSL